MSNLIGDSANPAVPGVAGTNKNGSSGFLGGTDPVFHQHAGVYGQSDQQGVIGRALSTAGTGVHGSGPGSAFGVRGETDGGVAVQGQDFSGRGLAGNFIGGVTMSSQLLVGGHFEANSIFTPKLTASTKNFLIDHPLDPENKYLAHASVESSEMKTMYDGTVELDGKGETVIEFPAWFAALNKEFRYQLTAIGVAAPNLHVAEEVSDSRFRIAGGKPGMKVCWQVTGVRHDPHAQAHPLHVEEEKPVSARRHYLTPELYSQPQERRIRQVPPSHLVQEIESTEEEETAILAVAVDARSPKP